MKKIISALLLIMLCLCVCVACTGEKTDPAAEGLDAAKAYVRGLYKNNATVTATDYTLVGSVRIGTDVYTVEWSAKVDGVVTDKITFTKGEDGMVTVDVDEKAAEELNYKLVATIKNAEGKTIETDFDRQVPKFKEFTYAEYVAAEDDSTVVVRGIITGFVSKGKYGNTAGNSIYFQDKDGGYYAYNLATDPIVDDKLEVGMEIRVTGLKDTYNGTYEIVNASVEVLSQDRKPEAPVDFTEAYKKATDLKDNALVYQQSMLVTIKGVTITGQDAANGYYKFKLGELESYIRISSSACPMTKDEQDAFIKLHTDHNGWTADVTGLVCVYNGAFYLSPVSVDAISNLTLPERSDAEKLEMELGNVTVEGVVTENKTIKLPLKGTSYENVTFTWTSDNAAAVVNATTGDLVLTVPDAPTTVKLTLTAKCGSETKTKEFTISLTKLAKPADIVNAAYALEKGASLPGKYTLTGVIVSIDTVYSDQYKNVTVTILVEGMTDKLIQCYRLKGEGAEKIAVGDNITVTGVIKNYNGKIEFDSGCTLDAAKTPAEVVDAAYALEKNASLDKKYTLTGVITTVDTAYSEQYKNVTVTIKVGDKADKLIQCYRLKGEGADTIKVGDTITVFGEIKNYNGTIEFNSGCVLVPTAAAN